MGDSRCRPAPRALQIRQEIPRPLVGPPATFMPLVLVGSATAPPRPCPILDALAPDGQPSVWAVGHRPLCRKPPLPWRGAGEASGGLLSLFWPPLVHSPEPTLTWYALVGASCR